MANISSLDALRKKAEEEQDGQEFYAGGTSQSGGGSGLNVVDPRQPGGPPGDAVGAIMARASAESASAAGSLADAQAEGSAVVEVVFYANGFTVDGGPLREPGVPENDQFLNDVAQQICPRELIKNGKPSVVKIDDKRAETYKPPAYVAFSGGGQTAGATASAGAVITPSPDAKAPEADESQPTVRIQLVFENRKRLVVKLNKTHRVRDLAAVADASGNVSGPYQLLCSQRGPPKPLTDMDATVEEAGLAGAAVNVKSV